MIRADKAIKGIPIPGPDGVLATHATRLASKGDTLVCRGAGAGGAARAHCWRLSWMLALGAFLRHAEMPLGKRKEAKEKGLSEPDSLWS